MRPPPVTSRYLGVSSPARGEQGPHLRAVAGETEPAGHGAGGRLVAERDSEADAAADNYLRAARDTGLDAAGASQTQPQQQTP